MGLPAVMMPGTLGMVKHLHQMGGIGIYVVVFLCLVGVLVFSLFVSMREESNVFYANASSVGYRMVEFNVGVNMYYLLSRGELLVLQLVSVARRVRAAVVGVFVLAWWAEIGAARTSERVCVRLYHISPCLRDHTGVLLRGCVLGACCAAWLFDSESVAVPIENPLQAAMSAASTVLLCTPIFYATKGILELSFGAELINGNAALLSISLPVLAIAIVYAYNLWVKPTVQLDVMTVGGALFKKARVLIDWLVRRLSGLRDLLRPQSGKDAHVEVRQTFFPSVDS